MNHCKKKHRYCPKALCACKGDLPEEVDRDRHGIPIKGAAAGELAAARVIAENGTPIEVEEASVVAAVKAGGSVISAGRVAGAAEAADIIARLKANKKTPTGK